MSTDRENMTIYHTNKNDSNVDMDLLVKSNQMTNQRIQAVMNQTKIYKQCMRH